MQRNPKKKLSSEEKARETDKAKRIIMLVCSRYGISMKRLLTETKKRESCEPRQIALVIIYLETGLSLSDSGLQLRKDHATVLHSINVVEGLIEQVPGFREFYTDLVISFHTGKECEGLRPPDTSVRMIRKNRAKNKTRIILKKPVVKREEPLQVVVVRKKSPFRKLVPKPIGERDRYMFPVIDEQGKEVEVSFL